MVARKLFKILEPIVGCKLHQPKELSRNFQSIYKKLRYFVYAPCAHETLGNIGELLLNYKTKINKKLTGSFTKGRENVPRNDGKN